MADLNSLFDRRLDVDPTATDIDQQLANVPDKPAVFLLADGDDRPILLATGLAVRTILRRRLGRPMDDPALPAEAEGPSQPTGSKRADLRPLVRRLYLHPTFSPFETDLWYLWLARRLFGPRYRQMLRRRHCWMIHAQIEEPIPRLAVTDRFDPPDGRRAGPMADRQSATRIVDLCTYLFGLCHDYQVLRQAPHGRPCEYKEMGRCLGPCDGTISLDEYRQQVAAAVEFAADRGRSWRQPQMQAMKQAAARLDFELAGRIKDRLARAAELDNPRYLWLDWMERANFLIVQSGQGKPQLRTFRSFAGRLVAGPLLVRSDPATGLREWIGVSDRADRGDAQLHADEAALLTDYLFRGETSAMPGSATSAGRAERGRGMFIRYTGQPVEELAGAVAEAFPPTVRKKSPGKSGS